MRIEKKTLTALEKFTGFGCNRYKFIMEYLEKDGFTPIPISLNGARFILLRFKDTLYTPRLGPIKVLAAHYDSASGSPGANDNAAAVIQLLETAPKLAKAPVAHNTLILFTDKEEVDFSSSPKEQGTFMLGEVFRKQGLKDLVFFNFDMCGRGDTVIISEAAEQFLAAHQKTNTDLFRLMYKLRETLLDRLPKTVRGRFSSLRTPFSDNLGFLLQGYPAIHFTMLPFKEVSAYKKDMDELRKEMRRKQKTEIEKKADSYRARFSEIQPETWNLRHGKEDTIESLTPEAFPLMEEILLSVSRLDLSI